MALRVDGDFGPVTIKALQRYLRRPDYNGGMHYERAVDGLWGSWSQRGLQRLLNQTTDSRGVAYYTGAMDNHAGPRTWRGFVRYGRATRPRVTGSPILDAVNASATGRPNAATTKYLQRFLNG